MAQTPAQPSTAPSSTWVIVRRWALLLTLLALTALLELGATQGHDPDADFARARWTVRPAPAQAAHPVAPNGFAYVRAGTFVMGSPSAEVDRQPWNDDEARHWVTLTHDFFIQETEVTQAAWMEALRDQQPDYKAPFRFHACGAQCPAESVTWFQAIAFANLRSAHSDLPACYHTPSGTTYSWEDALANREVVWTDGPSCLGYRLPTEAEWEFAARGRGPARENRTYARDDSPAALGAIAWFVDNSEAGAYGLDCTQWAWKGSASPTRCGPQPVAQKQPNNHGVYDMIGNVWEWTWDIHGRYPTALTSDPTGPENGGTRAIRGGSWYVHPDACRAASRSDHEPAGSNGNLGLRLVRTAAR